MMDVRLIYTAQLRRNPTQASGPEAQIDPGFGSSIDIRLRYCTAHACSDPGFGSRMDIRLRYCTAEAQSDPGLGSSMDIRLTYCTALA